uniref:Uncharacterized protein n=1 Tax=Romanomermis culicivorax TaxID=13658 RepID=A0A915J042_ROMCU
MMERNYGHLVTIASAAGLMPVNGLADYCASKYAAVGFHEAIDLEISAKGLDNVSLTLVCPYYIDTGMFQGVTTKFPSILPIMDPEYASDKIVDAILMKQKMVLLPRSIYFFYALKGETHYSGTQYSDSQNGEVSE